MVHGRSAVELLRQRATWTFELCCLESPINKWWSPRTRNRRVRGALRSKIEKGHPFPDYAGHAGYQDNGCLPKGWDWGVPFIVFKVFSLGVRVIFFFKSVTYSPRTWAACGCYLFEVLWISGFYEFNSSSLVRQATICPLPVVTFKFFPPISKSFTF